jgi:hypothetical protein
MAMRGTVSRADLRKVNAATYHQAWWPATDTVRYHGDQLPVWHEATGNSLDPMTGDFLPSWDQASTGSAPTTSPGTWRGRRRRPDPA